MNKPYQVFNVLTRLEGNLTYLHYTNPITDPLFVAGSMGVLGIETFTTVEDNRLEFRFTFESREAHYRFIQQNAERYDRALSILKEYWAKHNISWERYSSDDYYISEFVGKNYITHDTLFDYDLDKAEVELLTKNLLPLGSYRYYAGGNRYLYDVDLHGCRLMKERTGAIYRYGNRPIATTAHNYPTGLMTYTIEHAIDPLMYENNLLYRKLKRLCYDVELLAEHYISSCNYSACIVGNNSLGEHFLKHSHRLDDLNRPTLTIGIRLSKLDKSQGVIRVWQPFPEDDNDKNLYYLHPPAMLKYTDNTPYVDLPTSNRVSLTLFNASLSPHTAYWTNDIYMYFVFEHIMLKSKAIDQIKDLAQTIAYSEHGDHVTVYHYDVV